MWERLAIPGWPHGARRGNPGMDAVFQHRARNFDKRRAHSAQPFRQCIRPQQHNRAGFRFRQRRADSAGEAANQIDLESSNLVGRNSNFGQVAETRVHAVGSRLSGYDAFDHRARGDHPRARFGGERRLGAAQRHFIELFEGEIVAGEVDNHFAGGVEISYGVWTSVLTSVSTWKKRRYFSGSVLGFPLPSHTTWTVSPVASKSPVSSCRIS